MTMTNEPEYKPENKPETVTAYVDAERAIKGLITALHKTSKAKTALLATVTLARAAGWTNHQINNWLRLKTGQKPASLAKEYKIAGLVIDNHAHVIPQAPSYEAQVKGLIQFFTEQGNNWRERDGAKKGEPTTSDIYNQLSGTESWLEGVPSKLEGLEKRLNRAVSKLADNMSNFTPEQLASLQRKADNAQKVLDNKEALTLSKERDYVRERLEYCDRVITDLEKAGNATPKASPVNHEIVQEYIAQNPDVIPEQEVTLDDLLDLIQTCEDVAALTTIAEAVQARMVELAAPAEQEKIPA